MYRIPFVRATKYQKGAVSAPSVLVVVSVTERLRISFEESQREFVAHHVDDVRAKRDWIGIFVVLAGMTKLMLYIFLLWIELLDLSDFP